MFEFLYIWEREMKVWKRQKWMFLSLMIGPTFYILFFSVGMSKIVELNAKEFGDIRYLDFLIPGLIAINLFSATFLSSITVFLDKESKIFEEIVLSPLKRRYFVMGKLFASATKGLSIGLFVYLFGFLIGAKFSRGIIDILSVILFLLIVSLGFSALSVTLTAKIKSQGTYNALINTLMIPLILTSSLYYPANQLPTYFKALLYLNPMSHVINPLRYLILFGVSRFQNIFPNMIFLIVFSLLTFTIGVVLYERELGK